MKKKGWMGMVLSMLVLMAVGIVGTSCAKPGEGGSNGDTGSSRSTAPVEEEPMDGIKIVDGGVAVYTVVYPEDAPKSVTLSVNRFTEAIRKQTGVTLESKTDALGRGQSHDPQAFEILIGQTNYDESKTVLGTLLGDQYAIRKEGNKIVITAHTDTLLITALNKYVTEMIEPNVKKDSAGACTLLFREYTLPSALSDKMIRVNGKALNEFVIVYATERRGYQPIAEQLQTVIFDATGYTVPVYADTERTEGAGEILVGKTNRAVSQSLYGAKRVRLMNYEIAVRGEAVQLLCGGPYSARECVNGMRYSFLNGETLQYSDGTFDRTDLTDAVAERAEGTDLRIMTSNVLAARWGEDLTSDPVKAASIPPVEQRAEIYAAVLANSAPDAVGVQETDHKWVEILPIYLDILKNDYGMEYTWLFSEMGGKPNMTSILYRSDRLELIDSACTDYSFWEESKFTYHLRVLAWGKFRFKAQPAKEFILLNTHWSWETPEQIATCIREETELVDRLKQEHRVPLFCTGDFNNRQDSENILGFLADTGMKETMLLAKESGKLAQFNGGCGNVGSVRNSETYIDHIFGYGEFSVLHYETILGNRTAWLSDHSPQFADIQL